MKYIAHRRFKEKALCGYVNIPAMTELEEVNGLITLDGKPVCYAASENAHRYFARNDDGNGMLRGRLTQTIQNTLRKRDKDYQARWDKVWDDPICQPYKREEYSDFWLWSNSWFNASIEDLTYIANLISVNIK